MWSSDRMPARRDAAPHGPGRVAAQQPPVPVVLASASPRRADVLTMLGIGFTVAPAGVEERRDPAEGPRRYVARLSREKAAAVSPDRPGALTVAGDTIVVLDGRVLEKPDGPADAIRMLAVLSGRTHTVYSGLALTREGRTASSVALARVSFRELERDMIERYVETGEPLDKAGAYGIQGCGSALVEEIRGDYFTVVGFPVSAFVGLLPELGLDYIPGTGVAARAAGGTADQEAPVAEPPGAAARRAGS